MSPGLDSYVVFRDSNSQTTEKTLPLDPRRNDEVGGGGVSLVLSITV